jgi:uncharacterized membrane protein
MPNLPLHPAIVHLPLGLALVLPLVAAGLTAAVWRRGLPRSAFALLVGMQAVLVASGAAALQLGARDAHRVEAAVGEAAVERHEDRAEAFLWTAGVVLALSAALLVVPARAAPALGAAVVAGTVAVAALGFVAGEAGGELVYLRGAAAVYAPRGNAPTPAVRGARDGDD